MSMRECMINSELTLHIVDTYNQPITLIQFISKRGAIGVKYFYNDARWYL